MKSNYYNGATFIFHIITNEPNNWRSKILHTSILANFVKDKIKKWDKIDDNTMELRHIIANKIDSYNMMDEISPSELYKKMWIM